jgi:hypothetical protein
MTNGLHWEWRGFGSLTSTFACRFCNLSVAFPPETVTDLYLWKEKLNINIKLRKGAEEGLKFKRFKGKKGNVEQWLEDPEEIFQFPLNNNAWDTLKKALQNEKAFLSTKPSKPFTRSKILSYLQKTGYEILEVQKNRESRLLNVGNGTVKVEWCCISKPQSIMSVGLENWFEPGEEEQDEKEKITNLKIAIEKLDLHKQPLKVMNYLDILDYWANNHNI